MTQKSIERRDFLKAAGVTALGSSEQVGYAPLYIPHFRGNSD